MTRSAKAQTPRSGDPYGIGPVGSWIAPVLAIVGLVLVAIVTFNLLQGELPFGLGGSNGNGNGDGNGTGSGDGAERTPAPSNVVVVPEEARFEGSMVYAKAGNIWIQTDDGVHQLTNTGDDSMPSFSPDGQYVYYIHTVADTGRWGTKHGIETYNLAVPQLTRIRTDGSGQPERLASSKFKKGNLTYAFWIRQPVVSPENGTVAVVSDAPNPDLSTVVLQTWDPTTKKFTKVNVGVKGVLGHQDPEWRPDGQYLLYVRNGRNGSRGAPVIMRYNIAKGTVKEMTAPGYLQPSYSPDGKYIAATKTSSLGSDVVILDGGNGRELMRITSDQSSFAPVWSPAGDGVAFLHIDGQTVDLRLAKLTGTAPSWEIEETIDLTEVSDLAPDSRPDWFIPADKLPATPPPTIAPSPSGSAAASASASTAP